MRRIWCVVAVCAVLAVGAWTVLALGQVQDTAAPVVTERITATVLAKAEGTLVIQAATVAESQGQMVASTVPAQAMRLIAMDAVACEEITVGDELALCLQLYPQGGETLLECVLVSSGNSVDEALVGAAEKLLP